MAFAFCYGLPTAMHGPDSAGPPDSIIKVMHRYSLMQSQDLLHLPVTLYDHNEHRLHWTSRCKRALPRMTTCYLVHWRSLTTPDLCIRSPIANHWSTTSPFLFALNCPLQKRCPETRHLIMFPPSRMLHWHLPVKALLFGCLLYNTWLSLHDWILVKSLSWTFLRKKSPQQRQHI